MSCIVSPFTHWSPNPRTSDGSVLGSGAFKDVMKAK